MHLSIVTCTRNPDPRRFARVLAAVDALRVPGGCDREYVIVDSASETPVAAMELVRTFCAGRPWVRVTRTELPGLAAARRAALVVVSGDPIVWVDDDNLLEAGYLEAAVSTSAAHPEVAVWGAGNITVEFPEGAPAWVRQTRRATYQERAAATDAFGRSHAWEPFFPVGSGMVTRRAAMDRWLAEVLAGRASLTGRRSGALSSGDDAQVILGAIAGGAQVGVVAAQRLTHLIPRARTRLGYLARLEFALAESLRIARAESFPSAADAREPLAEARGGAVARRVARAAVRNGPRDGVLVLARSLGASSGILRTHDRPEPRWLRAAAGVLGLR
jgi:hypothetical protein